MRYLALALILLLLGCPQPERERAILINRCLTDAECEPKATCDLARQQCTRQSPDLPYRVMLQVRAQAADVPLVEQHVAWFTLGATRDDLEVLVPKSVPVQGSVKADTRNLEAEVTFTPVMGSQALFFDPLVVNARACRQGNCPERNLFAQLNPGEPYDVYVQPLVEFSRVLPPMSIRDYRAPTEAGTLDIPYEAMTEYTAQLRNEEGAAVGKLRVRLEDRLTGKVLSSTTTLDEEGNFTLYAGANLSAQTYDIAVSLSQLTPWQAKVLVDGAQLETGFVTMPVVPRAIQFEGKVEDGAEAPVPYANAQLVSNFPVPQTENAVGDRDWCRWRVLRNVPIRLACTATVGATASADGSFTLELLPGDYRLFATATREGDSLGTGTLPISVETRPPVEKPGPQLISLPPAARFRGEIRTYGGRSMPLVTMTARALSYRGKLDEVALYNRSASAISDQQGRFELAVDVGYYDLIIEPPADSGFAWSGSLNRIVNPGHDPKKQAIVLAPIAASIPVHISGKVLRQDNRRVLANARIEAFALVSSLRGGQRAVRIAQATSDAEGGFRLALPPAIGEELCAARTTVRCECEQGSGTRTCTEAGTLSTCECPLTTGN